MEQQALQPNAKNVPLQDGNMVSTGENTGAVVVMPESEVVLDENSAKLISYSFLKGVKCVTSNLFKGQMLINGTDVCFMTNDIPLHAYSQSLINVRRTDEGVELTVIEGAAEVVLPASMRVTEAEQLVVRPDGSYDKRRLKPRDAKRTAKWAKKYVEGTSTGKKIAQAAGWVVAGYVICRLLGGCDGGDGGGGYTPPPPVDGMEPPGSPPAPEPEPEPEPTPIP